MSRQEIAERVKQIVGGDESKDWFNELVDYIYSLVTPDNPPDLGVHVSDEIDAKALFGGQD